jgi:hypothetical protein
MSGEIALLPKDTRHYEVLKDFLEFMRQPENRDLRFWQGLLAWSGYTFIFASKARFFDDFSHLYDTFHYEGKRHDSN